MDRRVFRCRRFLIAIFIASPPRKTALKYVFGFIKSPTEKSPPYLTPAKFVASWDSTKARPAQSARIVLPPSTGNRMEPRADAIPFLSRPIKRQRPALLNQPIL